MSPALPRFGFGGMPLSLEGRPPETDAIRVIHAALARGVTLLDTADVYCIDDSDIGHNERLFARALREWGGPAGEVIVATKGGLVRPGGRWERRGDPAHLKAACERSLKALGAGRIDLYQLHAPDPEVPFMDSIGALKDLQRQGKIRWIGLSNVTVEEIDSAMREVKVVSVQNRLNPFFREALRDGVVRWCEQQGIGMMAYSPVGGGRLNKKLPAHPALLPLVRRYGVSAHAIVLAWVAAQGGTVIPIPAARTVEHAMDSLTAMNLALAPEDLAAIDRADFPRT